MEKTSSWITLLPLEDLKGTVADTEFIDEIQMTITLTSELHWPRYDRNENKI